MVERVGADAGHAVDIRLVVATNRPLRDLAQQGEFRSDLFYRLSGVELKVPPLRSRREDILELARYFLVRHGGAPGAGPVGGGRERAVLPTTGRGTSGNSSG